MIIIINLKQDNIWKTETKLYMDNLCNSFKPISSPDGFSDMPPLPSTNIFNFTE